MKTQENSILGQFWVLFFVLGRARIYRKFCFCHLFLLLDFCRCVKYFTKLIYRLPKKTCRHTELWKNGEVDI